MEDNLPMSQPSALHATSGEEKSLRERIFRPSAMRCILHIPTGTWIASAFAPEKDAALG